MQYFLYQFFGCTFSQPCTIYKGATSLTKCSSITVLCLIWLEGHQESLNKVKFQSQTNCIIGVQTRSLFNSEWMHHIILPCFPILWVKIKGSMGLSYRCSKNFVELFWQTRQDVVWWVIIYDFHQLKFIIDQYAVLLQYEALSFPSVFHFQMKLLIFKILYKKWKCQHNVVLWPSY